MFRLKMAKKPKLFKLKFNFIFPQIVLANMQEKEITPTKEIQIVEPDRNYDGLSKVIVDKIPDEYIIPSGNLEINQNGTFDVTDKVNAIVNVPEKKLGTKTITTNGTYKATDDNLDGYNEVEVATSGVDINDYIKNSIEEGNNSTIASGQWARSVKKLPAFTFNGKNASYHFYSFRGNSIDVSSFDTSNVTTMNSMFSGCSSLTSLDLSSFNTVNVTNMVDMFRGCSSLTSLDLSGFNTTNVINMNNMFRDCSSLTSLDVNNFNTSKVTNMAGMFRECSGLTSLDLSNLTATSLTNANMMFYSCINITSIDLSNFENTKTVSVSQMFQNCSKLSNLNMSKFDFTKISSYTSMFKYVPTSCYILVKDEAQKTAFNTKFPTMTNVHYVGEE